MTLCLRGSGASFDYHICDGFPSQAVTCRPGNFGPPSQATLCLSEALSGSSDGGRAGFFSGLSCSRQRMVHGKAHIQATPEQIAQLRGEFEQMRRDHPLVERYFDSVLNDNTLR
jgi:hypothetical protein